MTTFQKVNCLQFLCSGLTITETITITIKTTETKIITITITEMITITITITETTSGMSNDIPESELPPVPL